MRMRSLFSLREPGLLLSGVAHLALLVGGLVMVSTVTPLPPFEEGIAVEMITESEFSQITRGEETAAEVAPVPAPRAERVAEAPELRPAGEAARNTETPAARTPDIEVADRPTPAEAAPPPPPPPPPPAPAPVAEPAPLPPTPAPPAPAPEPVLATPTPTPDAPTVAQAPAAEPPPPAPLPPSRSARAQAQAEAATRVAAERERERVAQAETRAREQQERERREREQAVRVASAAPAEAPRASRVAEESDRFDPSAIASILRSTEDAASTGAAAPEVNRTASLGTESGRADRLSPSMIAQLAGLVREQLHACWNVPLAAQTAQNPPSAAVRLALNVDGSFAATPQVVNSSADPLFGPVSESALRAALGCAPLRIPAEFAPYYEEWRTMTVNFNPREA